MIREEHTVVLDYIRGEKAPVQGVVVQIGWALLGAVFTLRVDAPPRMLHSGFFASREVALARVTARVEEEEQKWNSR